MPRRPPGKMRLCRALGLSRPDPEGLIPRAYLLFCFCSVSLVRRRFFARKLCDAK